MTAGPDGHDAYRNMSCLRRVLNMIMPWQAPPAPAMAGRNRIRDMR
ncbi:hypothetical protein [Halomonas salipaludis]|nr:hypothetical protein [Halomonas salipaludis]